MKRQIMTFAALLLIRIGAFALSGETPHKGDVTGDGTAGWTNTLTGGIVEMESQPIVFADANVKDICVAKWDTNGDGELSYAEAAAVKDLGDVFYNIRNIYWFDELRYFTGLTNIGDKAFDGCTGLTSIEIPSGVTSIGLGAFYDCFGLTSIVVTDGNSVYDSRNNCNAIIRTQDNTLIVGCKNTTIPNSVTSIGIGAFRYCRDLISVTIPNSVTSIGNGAFAYCSGLISVTIPNSVTSIGNSAFENCTGLTSIEIPNSVKYIGDHAFKNCTGLTSIEIPNSVTSIKEYTFYGCSSLKSIKIPNSVTSIGNSAFENCRSLTSVISRISNPFRFRTFAFENISSSCKLIVPQGTKDAYIAAGWTEDKFKGGIMEMLMFADLNVKNICVAYWDWDTNGDGELTVDEAAAVKDLGVVFMMTEITSFDEFKYFTGVKSIGESAFSGCTNLKSIEIPNRVTSIGESAFYQCRSLNSIEIPNGVTSIGNFAFEDCSSLQRVTIPNSVTGIGDYIFSGCTGLTSIEIGNSVTSIGSYAFKNCTGLTSIKIPNSVTSIGDLAFFGCRSLNSIKIPNSVKYIGDHAFSSCTGLTSVISKITEPFAFGSYAFENISSSCKLIVPPGTKDAYIAAGWTEDIFKGGIVEPIAFADANVKSICVANWDTNGDGELSEAEAAAVKDLGLAFERRVVRSFDELRYFTGLTNIGDKAFYQCRSLNSIEIPNGVTSIGEDAFYQCTSLNSIEIPNGVTSIGNHAFSSCSGLTSITIPNSVTSIGIGAFLSCSGLTSIVIPNSVTSIGNSAFSTCHGLTSIEIPNSVTSIGNNAFSTCTHLLLVISRITKPFAFGTSAFENISSFCELLVPAGTRDAYIAAGWTENIFRRGIVEMESQPIEFADAKVKAICVANWDTNGDGELSEAEAASVTYLGEVFQSNTEITSFDEFKYFTGVMSIGRYAFWDCTNLKSIEIPNSVTSIGDGTFHSCSGLTSLIIGNSVTSIGDYAFFSCTGLTSIEIPNSVESIGDLAFSGCTSLTSIVIPNSVTSIGICAFGYCTSLTSIEIPNSVTSIGEQAFNGCSGLTSIEIPGSVTSIGDGAFWDCTGLTSIEIPNGVTSIGLCAFVGCTGLTSLTIPNSVTSIGDYAFSGCTGLTSVISMITEPFVFGSYAFNNISSSCKLIVPKGTKDAYIAQGWTEDIFMGGIFENLPGDANGDGRISVTDVGMVISYILQKNPAGFNKDAADVNGDGRISITDVGAIITKILSGK